MNPPARPTHNRPPTGGHIQHPTPNHNPVIPPEQTEWYRLNNMYSRCTIGWYKHLWADELAWLKTHGVCGWYDRQPTIGAYRRAA